MNRKSVFCLVKFPGRIVIGVKIVSGIDNSNSHILFFPIQAKTKLLQRIGIQNGAADDKQIGGKDFYLMEHDEYGDEAASIIVDATGKLVAEDLWDGFTPEIVAMIAQEQGLQAAPENYLAAAEGYSEENYNQIDGRMDTQSKLTPGDDTESQPEKQPNQKPSVLEKLKQKKNAVKEQKELPPLPQRETGRDHTTLE